MISFFGEVKRGGAIRKKATKINSAKEKKIIKKGLSKAKALNN